MWAVTQRWLSATTNYNLYPYCELYKSEAWLSERSNEHLKQAQIHKITHTLSKEVDLGHQISHQASKISPVIGAQMSPKFETAPLGCNKHCYQNVTITLGEEPWNVSTTSG